MAIGKLATGSDKPIHSNGRHVGDKRAFVFYRGRPSQTLKTNWIMQEFLVQQNSTHHTRSGPNDMKVDKSLENTDGSEEFNKDTGPANAPNSFNLSEPVSNKVNYAEVNSSAEVNYAEGPFKEIDTSMENTDGSDGFNKDIGHANSPNSFNLSDIKFDNEDEWGDHNMGLVNSSIEDKFN
ncbi:hypothetical protein NE237_002616 [Protea cynaroides]|uniref:NAC domain-containing protein n=1 Tax=Protea cynaroides TaxID=273540 RepID=A0A9Q0KVI2_9MAGN|nr:hypothetical protein NE237_002616 [Protea cynaroides]